MERHRDHVLNVEKNQSYPRMNWMFSSEFPVVGVCKQRLGADLKGHRKADSFS